MPSLDLAEELQSLLAQVRGIQGAVSPLTNLKPNQANLVERLEQGIKALPPGEVVSTAVEELRRKGIDLLARIAQGREDRFRHMEADLIRTCREERRPFRELDKGWRIGRLELVIDRPRALVQLRYNLETLTDWFLVTDPGVLLKAIASAEKKLEDMTVPPARFAELLHECYEHEKGPTVTRVSLRDLYPKIRLALLRDELMAGRPERRLRFADFPRWAYLHNLDIYRRGLSSLPVNVRLVFESGSQHDHGRGLCVVLNGLDAADEYKTYCWAYWAGESGR